MRAIPHVLYRHFDSDGALLYVGISKSNGVRQQEHARSSLWAAQIARVETQDFSCLADAAAAECIAIINEKPLFNIETRRVLSVKPTAGRVRNLRARMRKSGYVLKQIWVKPRQWKRIKKYLDRVRP